MNSFGSYLGSIWNAWIRPIDQLNINIVRLGREMDQNQWKRPSQDTLVKENNYPVQSECGLKCHSVRKKPSVPYTIQKPDYTIYNSLRDKNFCLFDQCDHWYIRRKEQEAREQHPHFGVRWWQHCGLGKGLHHEERTLWGNTKVWVFPINSNKVNVLERIWERTCRWVKVQPTTETPMEQYPKCLTHFEQFKRQFYLTVMLK